MSLFLSPEENARFQGLFTSRKLVDCAHEGDLQGLKWMVELGWTCNENTMQVAAAAGHFAVVKWLREKNNCSWDDLVLAATARKGSLEMVQWMVDGGCPIGTWAIDVAAQEGYLGILRYLVEKGSIPTAFTMTYAARSENLEMIKLLHEIGCPMHEDIIAYVAERGSPEMVEWLFEHGAPRCNRAIDVAARCNNFEVVKWLWENAFPCAEHTMTWINTHGSDKLAAWLKARPRQ